MKTTAPSSTKPFAVAKPIPVVPPVITATFPCNLLIVVTSFFLVVATLAAQTVSNHSTSGCLAVEPAADVRDRILVEASVKAAGDVADMRRCQQVRERAERMVERQRLLVEDIDGGAGDRLVFKRRNEICLDYDRSARRVYQARRRLHEC